MNSRQERNEKGQSVIIVSLMIVVLMAMAGLTIDVGRLYTTRQQLQGYTDAATLAGTRQLPYGNETTEVIKSRVDLATQRALQTYARNVGVDIATLPDPPYSYSPAWNRNGENMKLTFDMAHQVGGNPVTDHIVVTIFYHDALTEARGIPKERAMLVEASRDVPMIFGSLLGPPVARASRPAGAFKSVFEVKWKFNTQADVHGTPLYAVDSVDGSERVYTVSKSGYIFALDAWGEQSTGRTWAYWKFKVLQNGGGERTLCYPYTSKYFCEPPEGEVEGNYAIIGSPRVIQTAGGLDLLLFTSYPKGDDTESARGYLYALNAHTGDKVWASFVDQRRYQYGAYSGGNEGTLAGNTFIDSTPAFSPDGTVVYYASRDGRLYAFLVSDGSAVWSDCEPTDSLIKSCVKLAAGMIATPAVDPATGDIYVATSRQKDGSGSGSPKNDRGVVYKISPSGTILWTWYPPGTRAGYGFDSSPTLWPASNPDALYIGGRDGTSTALGYLYKLNPSTGALIWEYQVPTSLPGLPGNPRAAISNTPAIEVQGGYRYIYFSTEKGAGIKLRDGSPSPTWEWGIWLGYDVNTTASPPGPGPNVRRMVHGSPGLTSDFVYFGVVTNWDKECAFQAVRKSDGVIFQSFVMNNDTHSTLRVAPNNWLYYASCDNYTYGVDTNPNALDSRLIR